MYTTEDSRENCPSSNYRTPKNQRFYNVFDTSSTPSTPIRDSLFSNSIPSPYSTPALQEAKSLFRLTASPKRLIGREEERREITEFLTSHIIDGKPGSLYITGIPGTGKTALLEEIREQIIDDEEHLLGLLPPIVTPIINCRYVSYKKFFIELCEILCKDIDIIEDNEIAQKVLEDCLMMSIDHGMCVVILDEIDCIIENDLDILYNLFSLANDKESRLILIGISNLQFYEKLPIYIRSMKCEPKQVSFTPYNDSQIMEIIKDRLLAAASAEKENSIMMSEKPISSSLMQDKAIELCAKKVAACNGDLRLALNICMKAIELVEEELEEKETEEKKLEEKEKDRKKSIKKTVLSDSENSLEQQQKISMPEITITHINQIINTDIIISPITNRLRSLNHAQSMALFAIVCLIKKKEKKIDLTKIQEFLQVFSKRNPTLPLETNLCSLKAATEVLKNSNVIKISRANKITLSVRAKDVEDILKDKKPLLKKALMLIKD
ncbi:3516_t:CDS:2 [Entrophospora sp. SA101]|nr:13116_t:CDS:2 [Entrophospora sp. SA101]CAJ0874883.1 3516_t:CDS:2 [Entrophospora sp. SA101]